MIRIIIRGLAAVFCGELQVTDADILRSLDGLVYDEERFTDYIGGDTDEDAIAETLEPGGGIRFGYRDRDYRLSAVTEYRSRRPLSDAELELLVEYTMGQWSDGIGENWTCCSAERCGYSVMCLTPGDDVGIDYPLFEIVAE